MNLGIIHDEPNAVYHATDAVSHSKLSDFRRLPLYYHRKHVLKAIPREEPTKALITGSALHAALLEGPAAFDKLIAVLPPDAPRRPSQLQRNAKKPSPETIAAIEWWDSWEKATAGKEVLTSDDRDTVHKMLAGAAANPLALELLTHPATKTEVVFRKQMKHFTVQCRADAWNEQGCELSGGRPFVADVKTVPSLCEGDFTTFAKNFHAFGYHRQAAFYREVIAEVIGLPPDAPRPEFFFVVVEKAEPFQCMVFRVDDVAMAVAEREIIADLLKLRSCYDRDEWPGAPLDLQVIGLPEWYVAKSVEQTAAAVGGAA